MKKNFFSPLKIGPKTCERKPAGTAAQRCNRPLAPPPCSALPPVLRPCGRSVLWVAKCSSGCKMQNVRAECPEKPLRFVTLYEPWSFPGISTRILPSPRRGTGLSLNSWLAGGCSHCHWLRSIGSPTPAPRAHISVGWMVLEHMGLLGRQGSAVGLTGCGGPEGKPECLLQATLVFSLNSTENTYGKSPLWYKFEYMSVFRGNFLKI